MLILWGRMMKRGSKLGWALIGLSVIICGWTIAGTTITDAEGEESSVEAVAVAETVVEEAAAEVSESSEGIAMLALQPEEFTFDNGTLIITGDGASVDANEFGTRNDINSLKVDNGGGSIQLNGGDFNGCEGLKEIDFGNDTTVNLNGSNLTEVFSGCSNIVSINGGGYKSTAKTGSSDAIEESKAGIVYDSNGNIVFIANGAGVNSKYDMDGNVIVECRAITIDKDTTGISPEVLRDRTNFNVIFFPDDISDANLENLYAILDQYPNFLLVPESQRKNVDPQPVNPGDDDDDDGGGGSGGGGTGGGDTPGGGGGSGGGGSSSGGGSSDSGSSGGSSGSSDYSGSGVSTTVTYTITADGQVVKGHTQSATPKTADGFDERYLLSLSIFFCGLGFILYSRNKKYTMISELSDRD